MFIYSGGCNLKRLDYNFVSMILILSRPDDLSTDVVCDWISALGGRYLRINEADLRTPNVPFALRRTENGASSIYFGSDALLYDPDEVNVVWYRKWYYCSDFEEYFTLTENKVWASTLVDHMLREDAALGDAFFDTLADKHWLDNPVDIRRARKQKQLDLASKVGLLVPDTLITNSREEARRFLAEKGRIISKPLSEIVRYVGDGYLYVSFTREVAEEMLACAPEFFFTSLFQELIEKRADIRVYYLDGEVFPMAIFSQADARTALDFRDYIHDKPNRQVPCRLPGPVIESIRRLMSALGLVNGSIDLIHTKKGEHVFLEVNPVGQFGMTSIPCNYQLEKRIATYLIKYDQ